MLLVSLRLLLELAGEVEEEFVVAVPSDELNGDGAARVNPFAADFLVNHCVVVSSLGSLIQAVVGSLGGSGGLDTNRSGWAA